MGLERIQIAPEGPSFSRFAAGFWRMSEWGMEPKARLEFIEGCLAEGITTMDHADIYGGGRCEPLFGEALALEPSLRGRMELVTKCGIKPKGDAHPERYVNHYDTGGAHILASVDRSLRNLRTDHLDLLLIHRPDPLLNPDEVAAAFVRLRDAGQVKHFGVSNFSVPQFELLQSRLPFPLVMNQVEISPHNMKTIHDGTLDFCQRIRVTPMAWSCLAGGRLLAEADEKAHRIGEVLRRVMKETGADCVEQVIYAWILQLPCKPIPITGSGRIERVRGAVASMGIKLDRQQWFSIWEASAGHPVP